MTIRNPIIVLSVIIMPLISNVSAQSWLEREEFGGTGRYQASGFSIGIKGYIGLGGDPDLIGKKDFWEFDMKANAWTQKADYGGEVFWSSVGFAIGNKGYIATDQAQNFWEYDPDLDTWVKMADYPGPVVGATSFSIGTNGYIVTGSYSRELWEWNGDTNSPTYNTWTQKAQFSLSNGRYGAVGFSIGLKGYLGMGTDGNTELNDLWEWDGDVSSPTYNTWTQKASLPSWERVFATGFSIGTFGYIGTGSNGWNNLILNDLWRWDQDSNTWTQLPDLPGIGRNSAVAFAIEGIGYIGTGYGGYLNQNLKDFWAYCDTCHLGVKDDAFSNRMVIYPNPASHKIYIKRTHQEIAYHIGIYNHLGYKVLESRIAGDSGLDISRIPCGLYIINIWNDKEFLSSKLSIVR